jgi:hypothetical protein
VIVLAGVVCCCLVGSPGAQRAPVAGNDSTPGYWQGRPNIPDADPSVRHQETIPVPTNLRVGRNEYGVFVFPDTCCWLHVNIDVGYKMVVGHKLERYLYDGTRRIWLGTEIGAGPVQPGWGNMNFPEAEGPASRWGTIQILADIVMFETDVPSQHGWNPEHGKYRELWRGVAVGSLNARPQAIPPNRPLQPTAPRGGN